jgi:hypothetical protein
MVHRHEKDEAGKAYGLQDGRDRLVIGSTKLDSKVTRGATTATCAPAED